MSSVKKIIQINPELFKIGGKTRKNRAKKDNNQNIIVSPNTLKPKLLKRIKEHKQLELNKQNFNNNTNKNTNKNTTYDDEFYGAINYLSELSKKQSR